MGSKYFELHNKVLFIRDNPTKKLTQTSNQTNKQTSQLCRLGSKYLVLNNQQFSIIYVKKEKI